MTSILRLRRLRTDELVTTEIHEIRALMTVAFGSDPDEAFADEDWEHAVGGLHVVLEDDGRVIAHGSVVEREIHVGGHPLRTGYVEAVAVAPDRQGEGLGSRLMSEINAVVRERFDLGALGTGRLRFYERLGWTTWRGPAYVRAPDGLRRTPDDEGYIMVLPTRTSPPLDHAAPISCDWRVGDVW